MNPTTDPRDLLVRATNTFGDRVATVDVTDLDAPTPCADWTVRDLIDHVVTEDLWTPPLLAGETTAQIGDRFAGDQVGGTPAAAWRSAADAVRDAAAPADVLTAEVRRRAAP